MAEVLLNRRANIDGKGHDANIALHLAVSENKTDIVTVLLEREAETDVKDHIESTALHIASKRKTQKW
jgi:ankyrin repeat protein